MLLKFEKNIFFELKKMNQGLFLFARRYSIITGTKISLQTSNVQAFRV